MPTELLDRPVTPTIAPAPLAAVCVRPPRCAESRWYRGRYYVAAARSLARAHRCALDGQPTAYETSYRVTPAQRARWSALFGAAAGTEAPFRYYTTSGTLLLLRILQDLGANLRHLLHVQTSATFHARCQGDGPRRLRARLTQVALVGPDRADLTIEVEITLADGTPVETVHEVFAALDLPPDSAAALGASPLVVAGEDAPSAVLRRPPHRTGAVARVSLDVPADMGSRYGRLSGDMNVVHAGGIGTRVFGHRRPFIQGLCTANLVLAQLSGHGSLHRFTIVLARPVYVGQSLELLFHAEGFELRDETRRLVAFGTCRGSA